MSTPYQRFIGGCRGRVRPRDRLEVQDDPSGRLVYVTIHTKVWSADVAVPRRQIDQAYFPADFGAGAVIECYTLIRRRERSAILISP